MTNRKGFTLIELLVVVLIIGILASVALPQYFKTVEKSRSSEAIVAVSSIGAAQDREWMRNSSYAGDINELDVEVLNLKFFDVVTSGGLITATRKSVPAPPAIYNGYKLVLNLPSAGPGTGNKSWTCTPSPRCKTFLPGAGN